MKSLCIIMACFFLSFNFLQAGQPDSTKQEMSKDDLLMVFFIPKLILGIYMLNTFLNCDPENKQPLCEPFTMMRDGILTCSIMCDCFIICNYLMREKNDSLYASYIVDDWR